MNKKKKLLIIKLLLFILRYISTSAFFFKTIISDTVRQNVEKQILKSKVDIVSQVNKLTVGFGNINSHEFYFVKTPNKMFFQDKNITVEVRDVKFPCFNGHKV